MTMLDYVMMALRLTTQAYEPELLDLIEAAKQDLGIAGVVIPKEMDAIVRRAIVTYCKMMFYKEFDLKDSYDEQKAQLSTCTGYTEWAQ